MTTAVLTPYSNDTGRTVGTRLWRKQLLPVGSIDYKGRKLTFDKPYLADLAASFAGNAYDSVKFLLAGKDNEHTLDPERMRGTVRDVELTDDGLYGYIELSDDAAELVADHPDLGVSARIVEGLQRADGKTFPRAIQHVLGTLDPRVTGMKPWEAVDLATDADVPVIDLTETGYDDRKESGMDPAKIREALGLAADASDDDVKAKLAENGFTPAPAEPNNNTDDDDDLEAALQQLLDDANTEPAGASLSAEQQAAIDLANSRAEEAQSTARALAQQLAASQFDTYKAQLVAAGVPPADIDLAAPVLSLPGTTVIDLSNDGGEKVDVTSIVRGLLEARKGTVDLSREAGYGGNDSNDDDNEIQATLDAWESQYPAKR